MALRIIVDANIFISSAFGGKPQAALCLAFSIGEVFTTNKITRELLALPEKLSSKLNEEKQNILAHYFKTLLRQTTVINSHVKINICRDPKDNAYLEACFASKANILLTGDKDLLEISMEELNKSGLSKLKILTPAKFLSIHSV